MLAAQPSMLPGNPDQEDLLWAELARELQDSRGRSNGSSGEQSLKFLGGRCGVGRRGGWGAYLKKTMGLEIIEPWI